MLQDSLKMLGFQMPLNSRNAGKHLQTARAGVFYFQVHHLNMFTQVGTAFEGPGMGAWGEVLMPRAPVSILLYKQSDSKKIVR